MKEFGKIVVVVFCLGVLLLLAYNIHLRSVVLKQLQQLNARNTSTSSSGGASQGSTVNVYEGQDNNNGGSGEMAFLPLTLLPIGTEGYEENNTANVSHSAEFNNYDHRGDF